MRVDQMRKRKYIACGESGHSWSVSAWSSLCVVNRCAISPTNFYGGNTTLVGDRVIYMGDEQIAGSPETMGNVNKAIVADGAGDSET